MTGSCRLGSSCWSRGVKMEKGLAVSAVLVLSTRLSAVESFMRRAGSGDRFHAASFGTGCEGAVAEAAVVQRYG